MDKTNEKSDHINIYIHKIRYPSSINEQKESSSKKESIISKLIHKKEKSTNFESTDRNNNLYKSSKDMSLTEQINDHKRNIIYNNIYDLKNDYSTDKLMSSTKKNINEEEFDTSIENGNFYDIKQKPEFKYITPAKKKLIKINDENDEFVPIDSKYYNDYFSNLFVDNDSNNKKNVIISELEIEISVNSNNNVNEEEKNNNNIEKNIVNEVKNNLINRKKINYFHKKKYGENKNLNSENKNKENAQKSELKFKHELEEKLRSFLKLNQNSNSINDKSSINNNTNSHIKMSNNKHIKTNKSDLIRTEGRIRKLKQINSVISNNNNIIRKSNVDVNKLNICKSKNINTEIKDKNKFELSFTKNININLNFSNKKNILSSIKQKQNNSSSNNKKKLINYKTNMNFCLNSNYKKKQETNIYSNASGSTLLSKQRKISTRVNHTNNILDNNLSVFVNSYPLNRKNKKLIFEKRKNSMQYKFPIINNISSVIITPHASSNKQNLKKISPELLNIKLGANTIKNKIKNKKSDKKIKYNTYRSQDDKNQIIILKNKEKLNKFKNNSPITEKNHKKNKKNMNKINIDICNNSKNEFFLSKKEIFIKNKANKTEFSKKKNKGIGINCINRKIKI